MKKSRLRERYEEEFLKFFPPERDLVAIEELAREVGEQIGKKIPFIQKPRTRILDKKDITIRHIYSLLDSRVRGKLRELTLKSQSKDYSILIQADGVKKISRTFDQLMDVSQSLEFIDAMEVADDGYSLHIKELSWLNNCLINVYPVGDKIITFSDVFVLWDDFIR